MKIKALKEKGYTLEECVTNVTQYFELKLSVETLETENPESDETPESFYDETETTYVLFDEKQNLKVEGDLGDIKEFIEKLEME